jgi:uncharacterized membrane protein YeaQ/YmgE (transglycosylase-associated protein family)
MNLLVWAILGIIAGAIAKAIYPGTQGGGILSTMILGVIGAFVGGSIFTLINTGKLALVSTGASLSIPSIFVAVVGAMIAIFLWGLVTRGNAV